MADSFANAIRNLFKRKDLTDTVSAPVLENPEKEIRLNPSQVMAKRLAREKHYRMAEQAERNGNLDRATILYDLAEDPRAAGDCLLKLGRTKAANAMYFKAGVYNSMGIEPLPKDFYVTGTSGRFVQVRNRYTDALQEFQARGFLKDWENKYDTE